MTRLEKVMLGSLCGLIASLLVVGAINLLILRHIVQAAPAIIALVFVVRRQKWAPGATLPIFLFWVLLMTAAWLWLLVLARIVTGTFTPAEVVLTILIGGFSIVGAVTAIAQARRSSISRGIAAFILFGALQLLALWLSIQPFLVHR